MLHFWFLCCTTQYIFKSNCRNTWETQHKCMWPDVLSCFRLNIMWELVQEHGASLEKIYSDHYTLTFPNIKMTYFVTMNSVQKVPVFPCKRLKPPRPQWDAETFQSFLPAWFWNRKKYVFFHRNVTKHGLRFKTCYYKTHKLLIYAGEELKEKKI